jgi:hypothetical protein
MKTKDEIYQDFVRIWAENEKRCLEIRNKIRESIADKNKKDYAIPDDKLLAWSMFDNLEYAFCDYEIANQIIISSLVESIGVVGFEDYDKKELGKALDEYLKFIKKHLEAPLIAEKEIVKIMAQVRFEAFDLGYSEELEKFPTNFQSTSLFRSESDISNDSDGLLAQYNKCPICGNSDYSIFKGCQECLYRNRGIHGIPSLRPFLDKGKKAVDLVIKAELAANPQTIIKHLIDQRIENGKWHEQKCPKCNNNEYFIYNGCAKCGYKNRWVNRVLAAIAGADMAPPFDMMYMEESMIRRGEL